MIKDRAGLLLREKLGIVCHVYKPGEVIDIGLGEDLSSSDIWDCASQLQEIGIEAIVSLPYKSFSLPRLLVLNVNDLTTLINKLEHEEPSVINLPCSPKC